MFDGREVEVGYGVESRKRPGPAAFWDRDDVRGARNALDVWASCVHAGLSGARAVPTLEAIFEFPRPEVLIEEERRYVEVDPGRASTIDPKAAPRLIEYGVHWAMLLARLPALAPALMLELYPRTGPYEMCVYMRGLEDPEGSVVRAFRPASTNLFLGDRPGEAMQKRLDSVLNQIHRDTVAAVARVAAMPPEVFEEEIRSIKVPKMPKGKSKEGSLPAIETEFLKKSGLNLKDVKYAFSLLQNCDARRNRVDARLG